MGNAIPKDVHEAFRQVVYDFGTKDESGPERLGRMMGTSPGTLYNKCNINDTSHHKPTLADSVQVTHLTGDMRIVQAFAHSAGGVFYQLPDLSRLSTDSLMMHILRIESEEGDLYRAIGHSLEKDNKISPREYATIEREAYEVIAAIVEALARMREMAGVEA